MPNKIHNLLLAERERWLLWLPVLLGGGMGLYFSLPFEPSAYVLLPLLALVMPLRYYYRCEHPMWLLLTGLLVVGTGFAWAKIYTERQSLIMLERDTKIRDVTGQVVEIADVQGGYRVTLDQVTVENLAATKTPQRVRVKLRGAGEDLMSGEWISVRAGLLPPSGPAMPGGFDFARFFFFRGIGAVGYAIPPVRRLSDHPDDKTLLTRLTAWREALAKRVRSHMAPTEGSIAAALMMGERTSIPKESSEVMRATNLSHILAISGMHMAIVTGIVFLALRYALILFPPTRHLRHVKKLAATCALVVGAGYLVLSGQPLSAVRSFVMVGLLFVAVLLDREVMPMRSLAWAAMFLMLYDPSNVLEPGFQLSFAATVGLIAFYEVIRCRAERDDMVGRYGRRMWLYIVGILATTLVAEVATTPLVLYHFNNLSLYGMLANLLVMPLVSFVIMPFIIIAFFLMPMGFEAVPLAVVEWGVHAMLLIAREVAAIPGAQWLVPTMPFWGVIVVTGGGLWLCLWQTRWRYWGLIAVAGGLCSFVFLQPPDLFISKDGKQISGRIAGELQMLKGRAKSFIPSQWAAGLGQRGLAYADKQGDAFRCDRLGCIYRLGDTSVALVTEQEALLEDCGRVDLIVAPFYVRRSECKGKTVILDRWALQQRGTHWVWIRHPTLHSQSTAQLQGLRPWSVHRQE